MCTFRFSDYIRNLHNRCSVISWIDGRPELALSKFVLYGCSRLDPHCSKRILLRPSSQIAQLVAVADIESSNVVAKAIENPQFGKAAYIQRSKFVVITLQLVNQMICKKTQIKPIFALHFKSN